MIRFNGKEKMNTLLNIDNIFGEYEGRVMPWVIFLGLTAAPPLVWLFLLRGFMKFVWIIPLWIFIALRSFLIFPGKEKEKTKFYDSQRTDEYKSADELIHIFFIHDDGLIEYENGTVAYIISGFPKAYLNDAKLAIEYEDFFNELDAWEWDLMLHNVIDEILTEDELPKCSKYTDDEVIGDRVEFYSYQDEYSRTHAGLYRYNFLVRTYKSNWKKLKTHLTELVSSELCQCFNEIKLCNKHEVEDVCNRDLCGFIDISKMLTTKYENTEFHGSQVLWYDDEVPKKFETKKDSSDMNERRISQ